MHSMLEMRISQRQVYGQQWNFAQMYIIHVSSIPQSFITIYKKDRENEPHKDPKIRPTYDGACGVNQPCAGITLRVQAYSSLLYESLLSGSTETLLYVQPAVNRQPGYRWENS